MTVSALARTLDQEVLFRVLQGCFGAALVPLSQAIMLDIYPMEQRGMAMAVWATGVMIGPILGPTLGGYLTDSYDWRWVFFINVPFGILAVTGLVFIITNLLLAWFGYAYQDAPGAKAAYWHDSPRLEMTWTLVTAGILAIFLFNALSLWAKVTSPPPAECSAPR